MPLRLIFTIIKSKGGFKIHNSTTIPKISPAFHFQIAIVNNLIKKLNFVE